MENTNSWKDQAGPTKEKKTHTDDQGGPVGALRVVGFIKEKREGVT